ncbi:hypothetical protein BLBBOR_609 [Blattabacterium sp. (Blatta orientalis) str. Tarazona]|nr:hypothetical protein BLBBOR_609 [Blattabacterium sp. (Blatta orientalis) str. Tarazona]
MLYIFSFWIKVLKIPRYKTFFLRCISFFFKIFFYSFYRKIFLSIKYSSDNFQ